MHASVVLKWSTAIWHQQQSGRQAGNCRWKCSLGFLCLFFVLLWYFICFYSSSQPPTSLLASFKFLSWQSAFVHKHRSSGSSKSYVICGWGSDWIEWMSEWVNERSSSSSDSSSEPQVASTWANQAVVCAMCGNFQGYVSDYWVTLTILFYFIESVSWHTWPDEPLARDKHMLLRL